MYIYCFQRTVKNNLVPITLFARRGFSDYTVHFNTHLLVQTVSVVHDCYRFSKTMQNTYTLTIRTEKNDINVVLYIGD